MEQSQISRRLREESSVSQIATILSQEQFDSRSALGRRVCEEFSFYDVRGRPRLAGCMKALTELAARRPEIILPAAQQTTLKRGPRPRVLEAAVPVPQPVPEQLGQIAELRLILTTTPDERAIWNTLIAREHPHGLTTFAGCQLRYLIHSASGWLGAIGFSAAALRVKARDHWIAWDEEQRRAHLERVVCMNRFLIRPMVECLHLASHILGRVLRRLPSDFKARYGYCPYLVETYADEGVNGTCMRAANFVRVGKTAGRGRQDRQRRRSKRIKTVFMYALDPSWRRRLGVPFIDHAPVLEPAEGLNPDDWADNEFGGAILGDKRLSARLVRSASLLAVYPGQKINASSESSHKDIVGFYRLIDAPVESAVTVPTILAPHRERSIQRMRGQQTVLAIQDGSDLNFSRRPGCQGLAVIGKNQTSATSLGLHLHATLAVNENGLPLGLLRLGFDPIKEATPKATRQRKSERWFEAFRDTTEAAAEVSGKTRIIAVGDREADMFELFDAQRQQSRVELLVRAKHNRNLAPDDSEVHKQRSKLFTVMRGGDPDGMIDIEVEGQTARPKSSKQKARPARKKRLATCEMRCRPLTLPATKQKPEAEPVTLYGVHLIEMAPPEDEEPIQWFLLTTLKVKTAKTAAEVIGYYLQRWKVEDFFRVLKSGCRVEFLLFREAHRLQRAIAINAVIAWRIMVMTLLGRQVPDCDPKLMFTDAELGFLGDYASRHQLMPPAKLGDAVSLVAHFGGYRNRTHDPDPGHQIMWHGQTRLSSAALGHEIGYQSGFSEGKKFALRTPS